MIRFTIALLFLLFSFVAAQAQTVICGPIEGSKAAGSRTLVNPASGNMYVIDNRGCTSVTVFTDLQYFATKGFVPPARTGTSATTHNVVDYGAACDGVTDDTAAFSNAFSQFGTTGGTLFVFGTCMISPRMTILATGPVSLVGASPVASTIKILPGSVFNLGAPNPHPSLFHWSAGHGITVANLTIDLNHSTATTLFNVLGFYNVSSVYVNHVEIKNADSDLFLEVGAYNVNRMVVSESYFQTNTPHTTQEQAINLGGLDGLESVDVDIHDNTMVNLGVFAWLTTKLRVCGNDISGWAFGGGVVTGPDDTTFRSPLICNNVIHDSALTLDVNATHLDGIENWEYGAQIVGNTIRKMAGWGVSNGGGYSFVSNNTISDSGTYNHGIQGAIKQFGAITGGSGYTNGVYAARLVSGGTGFSARLDIVVKGGTVVSASIVNSGDINPGYTIGDVLSVPASTIGGTGSGFSITVTEVYGTSAIITTFTTITGTGPGTGTFTATGSTYTDNFIFEDGGGHTSYAIQDVSSCDSTVNVGFNTIVGMQEQPYFFCSPVNWQAPPTRDNRIINGCFQIDQRNEGADVVNNAAYGPDRWKVTASVATYLTYSRGITISADFADECVTSLKATVVSGSNDLVAGNFFGISTQIELNDVIDLAYSFVNPLPMTLEFCAEAVTPGTYAWSLLSPNGGVSFVNTYNLLATNTVECFRYLIPGDTRALGPQSPTNVPALQLYFDMGSTGTTQTSILNQWTPGAFFSAVHTTPLIAMPTNDALVISRVRLYQSNQPLNFIQRSYSEELALAQRYYRKTFPQGLAPAQNAGVRGALCVQNPVAGGQPSLIWEFKENMRAAPTITTYNPSAANINWRNANAAADVTVSVDPTNAISMDRVQLATGVSVATIAQNLCIQATADADF